MDFKSDDSPVKLDLSRVTEPNGAEPWRDWSGEDRNQNEWLSGLDQPTMEKRSRLALTEPIRLIQGPDHLS